MKSQIYNYLMTTKSFMRKHFLLFSSLKVIKLLVVLCLFSCENKSNNSKALDTIYVDSIQGNSPGDSTNFKDIDEEEEEEDEEGGENPLVPQES